MKKVRWYLIWDYLDGLAEWLWYPIRDFCMWPIDKFKK